MIHRFLSCTKNKSDELTQGLLLDFFLLFRAFIVDLKIHLQVILVINKTKIFKEEMLRHLRLKQMFTRFEALTLTLDLNFLVM